MKMAEEYPPDIGGIDIDPAAPGYRHVIIAPTPGGKLTSARTTLQTGYGLLATEWTLSAGVFTLTVTIPANTTASVTVPAGDVRVDGASHPNGTVIEFGSGRYTITSSGAR